MRRWGYCRVVRSHVPARTNSCATHDCKPAACKSYIPTSTRIEAHSDVHLRAEGGDEVYLGNLRQSN
eukprot:840231-Pleurochrysis_carterae.AAC.7